MILKFKFKNYKSFKNEVCLDLTAKKITEFSDSNFEVGNTKVLPVASIFGANASGKTNVMEAFYFMVEYVNTSLNFAGAQINPTLQNIQLRPVPFLLDGRSKDEGTMFEVTFILNGDKSEKTYQYGFVFNNNIIEEEWLRYRAKTSRDDFKNIFYRSKNKNDFSGIEKEKIRNIEVSIQKETLLLTLGAKLNEKQLGEIYNWFASIIVLILGKERENMLLQSGWGISRLMLEKRMQIDMVKFLSTFDDSIVGMDAKERETDIVKGQKVIDIYFHHKKIDSNDIVRLPLEYESAGTKRMFYLFPFFNNVMRGGKAIFIDELNERLHPILLKKIIQMFKDNSINKNKAQLIFTSHDIWQLKSGILRRDEIWFTEKDKDSISKLYSLSDFVDKDGEKIRKDEDYLKHYVQRKYGAVPTLKGFDEVFG